MKNMKKLLQRAMVFTLSAAMLVGTPMTASAAGLVDLYSISDGTGTVKKDQNPTGTITNTDTNTGFLIENNKVSIVGIALDRQTVNAEVGVQETLKATVVLDGKIYAGDDIRNSRGNLVCAKNQEITDLVVKEMSEKIHWQLMYTDSNGKELADKPNPADKVGIELTEGNATDRSMVTLTPYHGTKSGEEVTVRATIDASYYFDANATDTDTDWESRLTNDKKTAENKVAFYTADAKVSVKEYTDGLTWTDGTAEDATTAASEMNVKHTLDLSSKLVRDPATANDAITWTSSKTGIATVSAAGVVTAKKATADGESVTITAVSEHGAKATRTITIGAGVKASKVVVTESWDETSLEVVDEDGNNATKNITVVTYAKVKAYTTDNKTPESTDSAVGATVEPTGSVKLIEISNGTKYINDEKTVCELKVTDEITWSSNKTAFAEVTPVGNQIGGGTAKVTLKGVGKATITAKATNGAKATKVANVIATLTNIKIEGVTSNQKVYSGQSIQLTAKKTPDQNKDAVKWSIKQTDKKKKNPNATIDAKKGLLKIANKIDATTVYGDEVTVLVTSGTKTDEVTVKVAQSSINGITVREGTTPIAQVGLNSKGKIAQLITGKDNTSNINVPLSKTYTATVEGKNLDGLEQATLLTWKTSNAKVAALSGTGKSATITAVAAGKATITVSGVRTVEDNKGKVTASVISAKFTVQVKQPVTTLTMSKPTVTLAQKNKLVKKVPVVQDQKVSLKVTFGPKKADKDQTKIDSWTVQKPDGTTETVKYTSGKNKDKNIQTASLSYTLKQPVAGEVYKITAKSITGVTATSTITIVAPTTAVQILKKDGSAVNTKKGEEIAVGSKLGIKSQINIGTKNAAEWVDAGSKLAESKNAENVTYTVNKKGIVTVDQNGNIYAIKKGSVTITAKTPTGKKASLKVTVK